MEKYEEQKMKYEQKLEQTIEEVIRSGDVPAGVLELIPRPTPAAPKKPAHRPGGATAPRRTGRPDWDDSAKLDALRNKSPQKQRQKVHIINIFNLIFKRNA